MELKIDKMNISTTQSIVLLLEEALTEMKKYPGMDEYWVDGFVLLTKAKNELEEENLYKEVIDFYGQEKQFNLLTEEVGELLQALNKYRRDPNEQTLHHLAEERIDVNIMLKQLDTVLAPEHLEYWHKTKMQRTAARLETKKYEVREYRKKLLKYVNPNQRLFNVLHDLGVIATQDDMNAIIDAVQLDDNINPNSYEAQ